MNLPWIGTPKDLFWILSIGALFVAFTYWATNLPILIILLLVFIAKIGKIFWSCADDMIKDDRSHGIVTIVSDDNYPALMSTVNRCCRAANIPVPGVYLSSNPELNAKASGRNFANSKIVINQGLLESLTPTQLMGVIAHEISHIVNHDTLNQSICWVFCEALQWQAKFIKILFSLMIQTFRVHFILGIIVFLISASTLIPLLIFSQIAVRAMLLMVQNMSRTRELRADVTGARLCRNPIALAEALEILEVSAASCSQKRSSLPLKIRQLGTVNPVFSQIDNRSLIGNFIDGLLTPLLSTHPALDDRVRRLRIIEQERRKNM